MKLNTASSDGGNQQPPMGDASFAPEAPAPQDQNGMQDQGMGADESAMPQDPCMEGGPDAMGEDPSMMDPNAGMEGGPGPMGGEEAMGPDAGGTGEEGTGDDTMSIINQLSDTDREAVRAYAESMLSRDEEQGAENEMPMDGAQEQPMMEQVIFTKNQLQRLNEEFSPNSLEISKDDDREKSLPKKTSKTTSSKSPFNSPKFK